MPPSCKNLNFKLLVDSKLSKAEREQILASAITTSIKFHNA